MPQRVLKPIFVVVVELFMLLLRVMVVIMVVVVFVPLLSSTHGTTEHLDFFRQLSLEVLCRVYVDGLLLLNKCMLWH